MIISGPRVLLTGPFIPHGTRLGEAAHLVRGAVLVDDSAAGLLCVVASELDQGTGKPIAAALQRAVAPVTQHSSRQQVCSEPRSSRASYLMPGAHAADGASARLVVDTVHDCEQV